MNPQATPGPIRLLIGLGFAMLVVFGSIASLSHSFAYEQPQVLRPLLLVLSSFAISFAAYLAAIRVGLTADPKHVVPVTVVFAVAFRLVLLFSVPIQEIDIYRYVWDGQVSLAGVSPFAYAPEEVLARPNHEDLRLLAELQTENPAKALILQRIHFGHLPTVYPPVSQAVFATAAWTTPSTASFETHILVMKAWIVLFDLIALGLIVCTHRLTGAHPGWLICYAWCPLVVKEFANSGHLDAIAVAFTVGAILAITRASFANDLNPWKRTSVLAMGAVLLGLGVGAKLYPIVLFPIVTLTVWKRRGWGRSFLVLTLSLLTSAAALYPWLSAKSPEKESAAAEVTQVQTPTQLATDQLATHQSLTDSPATQLEPPRSDPQAGLKVFLSRWMMNDLIFLNIAENVTPDRLRNGGPTPWFVFLSDATRSQISEAICAKLDIDESQVSFLIARTITAATFGVLCLVFAFQASNAETMDEWLRGVFRTMAWFWLLLPTLNPWYWIWALPWIAYARSRAWLLMSGLLFVYYLRFYFGSHFPESRVLPNLPYHGEHFFDFVVVWLEYLPWLLAFAGEAFLRYWRRLVSADQTLDAKSANQKLGM